MNSITQNGAMTGFQKAQAAIIAGYMEAYPQYTPEMVSKAVAQAVLTPSVLRLEQAVSITSSSYYFPVKTNEFNAQGVGARPTEVRLHDQDAFYTTAMMMYISKVSSNAAPYPTNMLLDTSPNPITYPLAFAAGVSGGVNFGSALLTLWNGNMTLKVNERTLMTAFPLYDFLQIPQTQLTGATNSPQTEFDGTGVQFMEPNPVFIGTKKNQLSLNLPGNITTTEATPVIIVLKFWGYLAQNITLFT